MKPLPTNYTLCTLDDNLAHDISSAVCNAVQQTFSIEAVAGPL